MDAAIKQHSLGTHFTSLYCTLEIAALMRGSKLEIRGDDTAVKQHSLGTHFT